MLCVYVHVVGYWRNVQYVSSVEATAVLNDGDLLFAITSTYVTRGLGLVCVYVHFCSCFCCPLLTTIPFLPSLCPGDLLVVVVPCPPHVQCAPG